MASQYPSKHPMSRYDLEEALRDVWGVLKAHNPDLNWDDDLELQSEVFETLIELAHAGITDPRELRIRTLECFDLQPRH